VLGKFTPNLFFASGRICGSRSALRCVRGTKRRHTIFHAQVGPVQIPQKVCWHTLCRTGVFLHPVGSVGHVVHSSPVRFSNKHTEKCYAKPMFLHAVGSVGHIVHSGPSGHEMSRHYFSCLGGPGAVSIKSTPGHVTLNLWFCIKWDLRVT
jgi:hypothetical protein